MFHRGLWDVACSKSSDVWGTLIRVSGKGSSLKWKYWSLTYSNSSCPEASEGYASRSMAMQGLNPSLPDPPSWCAQSFHAGARTTWAGWQIAGSIGLARVQSLPRDVHLFGFRNLRTAQGPSSFMNGMKTAKKGCARIPHPQAA